MFWQRRWKALALQLEVTEVHCEGEFGEEELPRLGRVRQCPEDVSRCCIIGNPRGLPDVAQIIS